MRLEVSKDRWSKVSKSVSYSLVFTKNRFGKFSGFLWYRRLGVRKIVSKIVGLENRSGTKSIEALWRLVSKTDVLISLLMSEGICFKHGCRDC